jgi:hypothetical protein
MRKAGFSLALIIASNILIIGISLVYGLHIFPVSQTPKTISLDAVEEIRDLTIKKQGS